MGTRGHASPPIDQICFETGEWRSSNPTNLCLCAACGERISKVVGNGGRNGKLESIDGDGEELPVLLQSRRQRMNG